jgi:hypothetical protein
MMAYQVRSETEIPAESVQWHQKSILAPDPKKAFEWKLKMPLSDQAIFDEIAFITRLKKLHYAVVQRW